MNKLNIPGVSNGIPFNWDDLDFILGQGSYDAGIYQLLEAYFSAIDDNLIIQGCMQGDSPAYTVTPGWVLLDGEILYFEGGTGGPVNFYFHKQTSNNSDGNKQTQLSGTVDIYQENRAIVTSSSSNLLLADSTRLDEKLSELLSIDDKINPPIKTMSNGETYVVQLGVTNIFIPSGANNCTVRLPNASTYSGWEIVVDVNGISTGSVAQYPSGTDIANLPSNNRIRFISNGTDWYFESNSIASGLACPFVYVNGTYFDEILKNIINEDGEETIDISAVLKQGQNKIVISEEKDEITYMKELYFNDTLIFENLILNKGDRHEFKIEYNDGPAKLTAKGHYIQI